MLNLVASGMLLRPIDVWPPACPSPSSPSKELPPQIEKEPFENSRNATASISNGISKDTLIIENSSTTHKSQLDVELTNLVQNGVNDLDNRQVQLPEASSRPGTDSTLLKKTRISKVLDFSLLKNPFFCIYTWSLVFSQLAYFIPYFHLSARARMLDIDAMDASFIISVAGEIYLILQLNAPAMEGPH